MKNLAKLILLLLSFSGLPLYAQTAPSPVTGIPDGGGGGGGSTIIFQQNGSGIGTAATINCSTNLTCTFSNGTVTIVSGGSSGGSSQTFNVLNYGAVGDGYHIAADTAGIKAAFAASAPTCGTVYFPGNHSYGFDTITASYTLTNFCGTIQGDGYSSTITSNSDINSMWNFITPHDLTIKNLHFQQTPAGFNNGTYPVGMDTGTNILIEHNYSNDGDTAWRIGNSTHVRMEGNSCSNFHGNCLFGPNNNDLHMVNTSCFNNGDTCEEFSRWHFETSPTCQGITSTGLTSFNDGTGFIVDSCTDVALSNFTIWTPGGGISGGIFIAQDQLTTNDHYPNRVQVSNGVVYGAGYSNGNINNSNATPCITLHTIDNIAEPYNVELSNLHLEHCAGSAIYSSDPNFAMSLVTSNIKIIDAGNGGTSVGDPKNIAFNFIGGKSLKATNTYIENANGSSFQAASGNANTYVELTNITSVNPNQRGTGSFVNAIHNRNTNGTFLLNDVSIIDTWPSASRSGIVSAATTGNQAFSGNLSLNCTVTCGTFTFASTTTTSARPPAASTVTNNDCVKFGLASNVVSLVDAGAPCGSGGGGITGLTTGFVPKAASSTTIANSLCDEGITTANTLTCTDTAGLVIPKVSTNGTNGGVTGVEGTGASLTPAAGTDLMWADSTAHRWKMNNNNGTSAQVVASGVDVSTSDQVTVTHLASPLPVNQGGTATTTPALVAGTGVTITGSWPNQTINASAGGVSGCSAGCNYVLTQGDAPVAQSNNSTLLTGINVPNLVQFYNPLSRVLGNAVVRVTIVSAGGHFDVGVYSVSGTTGTLVWHTGSLSTATSTSIAVTPTPATLSAGTSNYIAWCADNTTVQILAITPSTTTGAMAVTSSATHTFGVDATDTCTAGVLAGTITTTNITNNQSASVPYVFVSN